MMPSTVAFFRRQNDFGLGRKFKSPFGDDLRIGLADRSFDHLGHRRFAIEALEMSDRHLARPKTPELHAPFEIIEPGIDLGFKIGGRNNDAIFALETGGGSFSYLHRHYSSRAIRTKMYRVFGKSRQVLVSPNRQV